MEKVLLVVGLLVTTFTAIAQMTEAQCYKLQTDAYKHADSKITIDKARHLELSLKLTEECGYLMSNEVLKQRREYNYLLHLQLNK